MTRKEIVEWLKNEVTMSGTINISLTDAEYERLVDKELRMVYQLYPVAIQKKYCVIDFRAFYTKEFRANRTLQFPDCVVSVGKFEEMKRRNTVFGINDPDFSFNKSFMADMWLGAQMNLDSVMYRTIQWSVYDQLKQFTLVDIKRSWNEATHQLVITGHDPQQNVFCVVHVKAPEAELFDDPWVRQWLAAKCKLNVAKTIGTFTTTMIGGVSVNTNLYTEEANKEIEECKEQWKIQRDADMFFLTTP